MPMPMDMFVVPLPHKNTQANPITSTTLTCTGHRKDFSRVLLVVDPKVFGLWWCTVCLVHGLEIAFLVASCYLYYWILHNEYVSYYFFGYYAMSMPVRDLKIVVATFATVASLHGVALGHLLWCSWRQRQLAFSSNRTLQVKEAWGATKDRTHLLKITGVWDHLIDEVINQLFLCDGRYFDDAFLVQECLEVLVQVYQGYQMSVMLATRWINNVFVCMIVLNGISTPFIHRFVGNEDMLAKRRLCEVTTSLLLNLVNSVVLPAVILDKYVRAYNPVTHYFEDEDTYNDVWYARSVRENRLVLVTSLFDLFSTIWPHICVLNHMLLTKSILQQKHYQSWVAKAQVAVAPQPWASMASSKTNLQVQNAVTRSKHWRFIRRLLYNSLWVSAMVVLGVHIAAQSVPEAFGCKLQATPWFSGHNRSCVVMNVNCFRQGIDGNESQMQSILSELNADTLVTLVVTHCPALEMPSVIHHFHQLDGIDIYNCTLVQWSAASGVVDQFFPVLSYVYFIQTNLSAIIPGLLEYPLASSVVELDLYQTNLSFLPPALGHQWRTIQALVLEFDRFDEIPLALYDIPLQYLSLVGNSLQYTRVDVDLFDNKSLCDVRLSGTKLNTLPNPMSAASLSALFELALEHTQLQSVPESIRQWYLEKTAQGVPVIHSLFGSPYCSRLLDQEETLYQQQVCSQDLGSIAGYYPIQWIAPQRLL